MFRSGALRRDERLLPSEAAWCPDCGAFREQSATIDPSPWELPKAVQGAPATEVTS